MADNVKTDQWRWKNSSEHDRSRRDEVHHHGENQDNSVVLRKKNRDQRRRQEKMKKRWSVRPDVNLTLVPQGMQCKIITAIVFIFFGLFLTAAGVVILIILKNISHVVWSVGIGMLVLGFIIFVVGLFYMLFKCCFRTSTRYKQYKAQFKSDGKYQMSDVSEQSPEIKRSPVKSSMHYTHQGTSSNHQSHMGDQPSDATTRTYVTATENTPSMPNSSTRPLSTPQWITPGGYRPMMVNDLSEFTMDMQTADEDHLDDNGHGQGTPPQESRREDTLSGDFAKLEDALRELILKKSRGGETEHLMRGPIDTSTPVNPKAQTHYRVHRVPINIEGDPRGHIPLEVGDQRVHSVPIMIEGDPGVHGLPMEVGDHGVHRVPINVQGDYGANRSHAGIGDQGVHTVPIMVEGDHGVHRSEVEGSGQGVHRVPIMVEGDPRATTPTPIPPSYDQVLRNYRTYSRSASPTRIMESDV
ncbi:uncharacterized protein LOC129269253 [Lytechinus pictus]|uniref:uncharacterized protein LOC129269253 n=1 Tax=Lytechinus pictus TaxID=7653 RepID=UPI0030B9D2F4